MAGTDLATGNRTHILVVDDEPSIVDAVSTALRVLDVLAPCGIDGKRVDDPIDRTFADVVVLEREAEHGDERDGERGQREEDAVRDRRSMLCAAGREEPRRRGTGHAGQSSAEAAQPHQTALKR